MAWTRITIAPLMSKTVTVVYKPEVAITIWPPPPTLRSYGSINWCDDTVLVLDKTDGTKQTIPLLSVVEIKEGIVTGEEAITTTQAGLFGDLLKNPWAIAALALGGILAYQTWGQKPKKAK